MVFAEISLHPRKIKNSVTIYTTTIRSKVYKWPSFYFDKFVFIHKNTIFFMYSKALRYADFGPKSISVAQKTLYLEAIWKPFKTVYLWGFDQKNDNQCNFWQNLKPCIFKISASWGCVAQGLAVYSIWIAFWAKNGFTISKVIHPTLQNPSF